MYVYTHLYIHNMYMYVCMYVCIYIYTYIHTHTHIHIYIYIYILYTCMPRARTAPSRALETMPNCPNIYIYTHNIIVYVCICVYMCIYIYIYIYISCPRGDRKFGDCFLFPGCLGGDFGESVLKERRSERARLD